MKKPKTGFYRQKNELYCEGVPLADLAKQFGTPLYVYSAAQLEKNLAAFWSAVKKDAVSFHFAMKANSNSSLLKVIRAAGFGVDLVTFGEWWIARRAGFSSKECIWSGLLKTPGELLQVLSSNDGGVEAIHVESIQELEALMGACNTFRRPVRVGLRFRPEIDAKTHSKIATGRKGDKFGLSASEILDTAERLKNHPFIRLTTLSIHIGSQILSVTPYKNAFTRLQALRLKVEKILGEDLECLDLGGGFGISYNGETELDFAEVYKAARKIFGKNIKLSFEPGRSVIANAGALLTRTVYTKKSDGRNMAIVDAAMNDLIRPAMYDAHHGIELVSQPAGRSGAAVKKWDIVGGVCESSDFLGRDRPLPLDGIEPLLAIRDAGAYGYSMASQYNARMRPAEVLVRGTDVKLIRRRDNLEDLVRNEAPL